jgi:rhodanese-related sulfurtransferase
MHDEDMTPSDLAARIAAGNAPVILDVREQWEFDVAHIAQSVLIPLSTLPSAIAQLDRTTEYVMLCHHGMRSEMGANFLRGRGFERVRNLVGGIDAWSTDVDATVARY